METSKAHSRTRAETLNHLPKKTQKATALNLTVEEAQGRAGLTSAAATPQVQ